MGDYLGATICVAELLVSTLLLLYFQHPIENGDDGDDFYTDDDLRTSDIVFHPQKSEKERRTRQRGGEGRRIQSWTTSVFTLSGNLKTPHSPQSVLEAVRRWMRGHKEQLWALICFFIVIVATVVKVQIGHVNQFVVRTDIGR